MKAVLLRDRIYFQYLNLNIKRYIECRCGKNQIQMSLTLNQEIEENCTIVIPSFHTKILDWWGDVIAKGEAELAAKFKKAINYDGNTLKTNDIYTPVDIYKYGKLVPAVYGPGDIRISRLEILYRSTANKNGIVETRW
ncbi:hypothetical protein EV426DRAFT_539251 [Tirmania nivea]|nr:hypothetical protein EV426DRAFT_539251 [Tirmania nivea]